MDKDACKVAEGLNPNGRQVICSLNAEFQPPPKGQTRQQTAHACLHNSNLIEKERQSGCDSRTYYRLTSLGLEVLSILERNRND